MSDTPVVPGSGPVNALIPPINEAITANRLDEAEALLRRALKEFPNEKQLRSTLSMVLNNLGSRALEAGQQETAKRVLSEAHELDPGNNLALRNLAISLRSMDDLKLADVCLGELLRRSPRDEDVWLLAIRNRLDLGDAVGGQALAGTAVHYVNTPERLEQLGWIHLRLGQEARAAELFHRALQTGPRVGSLLGAARIESGRNHDEAAIRLYRTVEQTSPSTITAKLGARLELPRVYASGEHVRLARERFDAGVSELLADAENIAAATSAHAFLGQQWRPFLLAYQGLDDRHTSSRLGDFFAQLRERLLPEYTAPPPVPTGRKPVVALVSSFFRDCTVGHYFASWVAALGASDAYETVLVQLGDRQDAFTRELSTKVQRFMPLRSAPLQAAKAIRELEADVIIYPEVGMDALTYMLAGLRLGRVQCAAWGHPDTTGLPTIDRYLTCGEMETQESRASYREQLIELPGLGTAYRAPRLPVAPARGAFGLPDDAHLYLISQAAFKVHPANDELYARIAQADPKAVFVLFAGQTKELSDALTQRIGRSFDAAGVDPEERFYMLPMLDRDRFLQVNEICDVMLDSLHWSGGNTSLDAIAAGVPIVTLPGRLMRGRQTAFMLRRLGLADECVAHDEADYVRKAVALAQTETNAAVRQRMRREAARLFDDSEPVQALLEAVSGLLADA